MDGKPSAALYWKLLRMSDHIEFILSLIGIAAILWATLRIGQISERRRRKARPRKSAPVLQFKTPGEAGMALAAELNKRKPDLRLVDMLVKAQNDLRRVA